MKQTLFTALLVAALPATVAAQRVILSDPQDWWPRVRVAPFAGFGPSLHSRGELAVAAGNQLVSDEYDFEYASGLVTGLNLEVRLHSRYSLLASAAWSRRNETVFETVDGPVADVGSDFWMGRLAAALRLREESDLQFRRVSALLFAGAAMVQERPENHPAAPAEWRDEVTHWGIHVGAEAEIPLTRDRLSLTAGFDDTMMFWNAEGLERHLRRYYQDEHGIGSVAEADPDLAHMFTLRVGLAFRFGR